MGLGTTSVYGQRALLSVAFGKAEDGAAVGGKRYPWEINVDVKLLSLGTEKPSQVFLLFSSMIYCFCIVLYGLWSYNIGVFIVQSRVQ